jgi:hypothetical protein
MADEEPLDADSTCVMLCDLVPETASCAATLSRKRAQPRPDPSAKPSVRLALLAAPVQSNITFS